MIHILCPYLISEKRVMSTASQEDDEAHRTWQEIQTTTQSHTLCKETECAVYNTLTRKCGYNN